MLVELAVENYAVIENVRVRFHPGLNLLTGETGSGKSIVVDALGLLFGGRSSPDMIRTGAQRARISGIFEVAPSATLTRLIEEAGIEIEDNEILIEREIQSNGKSRAFVGNRPATVSLLKELAPLLGDIHGQYDQQQLFSPEVQTELLDVFAGETTVTAEVATIYKDWKRASAELAELERGAQEKLRLADLWQFQRKEIEYVNPRTGEDGDLENERRVLRNVVKLQETASSAYAALYDDEQSIAAQLRIVLKRLEDLSGIDANAAGIAATLDPARLAVDEASHGLRHYLAQLEADPERLDEIETRLAGLEKLKRKYGPALADVLAFLETVRHDIESAETSNERRDALVKETASLAKSYEAAAARLSAVRKQAARQLAKKVETELAALAMEKTRIEIRIEPAEWSERGADAVSFLIAPNLGEELKPLEKIASGGELSRVALALKTCTQTTKTASPRTLVFDEVDAGVGGSAAEAIGRRLKKLSGASQVLCVTHLAQIAGFADHHYLVEKHASKGRTSASIAELPPAERTREIGRMLSGDTVTAEALRHAETLIRMAAK